MTTSFVDFVPQAFFHAWSESLFRPHRSFGIWREPAGRKPFLIIREHWLLLIVVDGAVTIEAPKGSCDLGPGEMLIVAPSRQHHYQVNHHDGVEVIRLPMEWIPGLVPRGHPLERLPGLTPVPHPDLDRVATCAAALNRMQDQRRSPTAKMAGQVWLMELLTACVIEGFRLGRYPVEQTQDGDWVQGLAMELTRRMKDHSLRVEDLARHSGRSVRRVQQAFQERFGEPPITYLNRYRVLSATRLIEANPDHTIIWLMQRTGFRSRSLFNRMFKRFTGTTPSAWRADRK